MEAMLRVGVQQVSDSLGFGGYKTLQTPETSETPQVPETLEVIEEVTEGAEVEATVTPEAPLLGLPIGDVFEVQRRFSGDHSLGGDFPKFGLCLGPAEE